MKPRILIDLERMRYPYSGLGYYCRALAQGFFAPARTAQSHGERLFACTPHTPTPALFPPALGS